MKTRIRIVVVLACIAFPLVLFAAGKYNGVNLTFLIQGGASYDIANASGKTYLAAMADEFKSETGASVTIVGQPWENLMPKIMTDVQPMKMAAAEALWETEQPAGFSLFTLGTLDGKQEVWSLKVPGILSFLATGDFNGKVLGINDLVKKMETEAFSNSNVQLQKESSDRLAKLGVTDWVPNIPVAYWTFRLMMGLGFLSMAIGLFVLWITRKDGLPKAGKLWTGLMFAAPLSSLFAISFGWIFTEMGRQPFIVFGVLPTMSAVSPGVGAFEVGLTMVLYTVIYGALAVVEVGLLMHYIKLGLPDVSEPKVLTDEDAPLSFAY